MPTIYIYILFDTELAYYQLRCKNNRDLNNWFDALECRGKLQEAFGVREKEQIISSFFKIKNLNTVPLSYVTVLHYFCVIRKDTVIRLDLSKDLFSSDTIIWVFVTTY